jgi:DMSO/TMAO reductase YedYZ molybdopterin-dependent catalytic subunit
MSDRPRLPPGQIVTAKWPVLHYSDIPRVDTATWTFRLWGEVERPLTLSWKELGALPTLDVKCDIHCVTKWSRYDNLFTGVPVQLLFEKAGIKPSASHAHSCRA